MQEAFDNVGKRISTRLNELNLKQADLCRETGISRNAVSQYVTGKRIPDTSSLYKISDVLCVSMEWLLTGNNTSFENTTYEVLKCDNTPLSDNEIDLIAMYRLLESRDQGTAFNFVEMLYKQATGELESIYSTYTKEEKGNQKNDHKGTKKNSSIA